MGLGGADACVVMVKIVYMYVCVGILYYNKKDDEKTN